MPIGANRSWLPVTGDWNGDGFDTVGLYDPQTSNWYLSNGTDAWEDVTTIVTTVNIPQSWLPIAGNWDGEGGDGVGLYDPETQQAYYLEFSL